MRVPQQGIPASFANYVTREGHDEETLCPEYMFVAVDVEKVSARVAAQREEAVAG